MSSLISDAQKDILGSQFFSVHDTFARPIAIYKNAKQTIISTKQTNNYMFENAPTNDVVQNVQVSGIFMARILYDKEEMLKQFSSANLGPDSQVNLLREDGGVRIQVDYTGAQYLFGAQLVTFDGEIFNINSTQRPHGLFAPKFYTFYLAKLN